MGFDRGEEKRPVILYVEDEESERVSMARLIENRLGRVLVAPDAKTALEILQGERVDAVLSDICMPGEDGLELARKIRALNPGLPVVLISAHNDNVYLHEAIRVGVRDFLFKPVRIDHLTQTLERVINESRLAGQYDRLRLHNLGAQELGEMAQLYRFFKPLADASPLLIWVNDTADNCVFVNKGFSDFVGRSQSALLGKGRLSSIHPEDRPRYAEALDRASVSQTPVSVEYRLMRGDGEYRWVLDHAMPRFSDDRFEGFVGSCIDVTDVRQTRATQEADARYRALFNAMLNPFCLHEAIRDETGRVVDFRYLEVNPAFEKLTGLTSNQLVGRSVLEVFPQAEPSVIRKLAQVVEEGKKVEFEYDFVPRDQHLIVSAFTSADRDELAVVIQDIAAVKRCER